MLLSNFSNISKEDQIIPSGNEVVAELDDQIAAVDKEYQRRSESDFMTFLQGLVIPTSSGKRLFFECGSDFQLETFRELSESLHAIKDGIKPKRRRIWIERTKGASKDGDLAIALMWLLAFPSRPLYLQVGAADKDQAAIIRRRMEDLLYYNPWLNKHVKVNTYEAFNIPGRFSKLDILAADIAGSHGETPDVLIINELSHVTKWEFIENLLDNADKVANNLVIIATNAGFKGTKAEKLRQNAEKNPKKWSMHIWDRPAPWISKEDMEDAKQRNLRSRFMRLWYGRWASGKGDALQEDDISRVLSVHLGPLLKPEKQWIYLAGLDLGISHDHAGLAIVGVNSFEQRIRLTWVKGWVPSIPNDKGVLEVDAEAVSNSCLWAHREFNIRWFGYDPAAGGSFMAQALRRKGVPMKEMSFSSPTNCTAMATSLVQLLTSGRFEAYEDDEGRIRRDFGKFNIKETKGGGYKLEAVSDEFGHADVGTALIITLPMAITYMNGIAFISDDEELVNSGEEDLTKDEINELPDELKDIYDAYDSFDKEQR